MLPNAMKMAATLSALLTRYRIMVAQHYDGCHVLFSLFQCVEAAETCVGNEEINYTLSVSDGKCKKVSDCSEKLASWSCNVNNTNLTATLTTSVGEFKKTLSTNLGQFS